MYIEVEIKFNGVKLLVQGDFTPETPMVWNYGDGSGHPGDPEEFQAQRILFKTTTSDNQEEEVDVFDIYDSLNEVFYIEEAVLEVYKYEY